MVTPSLRKLRYVLISRSIIQAKPLPRNSAIYGKISATAALGEQKPT